MNSRLALLLLAFVPFLAFSLWVVSVGGPVGFVDLSMREPWALQMFLDVVIAMGLFCAWMFPDARARGVSPWPWVLACAALGSIGALGYLVTRELSGRKAATPVEA